MIVFTFLPTVIHVIRKNSSLPHLVQESFSNGKQNPIYKIQKVTERC